MPSRARQSRRHDSRSVLLVSDDPGLREQVGGWLEGDGFMVMTCPGPRFRRCVGLRGELCVLERSAGLVVLDLHPDGRGLVDNTTRPELIEYYRSFGHPLVVLTDEEGADLVAASGAVVCGRTASRGDFLAAARSV